MKLATKLTFSVILFLLSGYAGASKVPCGEPKQPLKPYGQHTLMVWQDCSDLTWHVRAYHGKLKGTIYLSDLAVMYKDEVSTSKNSKLKLNNGEMKATIDFNIVVPELNGSKEFSFAVPLYARMVMVMQPGSKASVRYGDMIDTSGITNLINPTDVEMHLTEIKTE